MLKTKEFLDTHNVCISLDNSERSIFSAYEIKSIIDNPNTIIELYDYYPLRIIASLEDYYLFFLSKKILSFREDIPFLVNEDHKSLMLKIVSLAENNLSNIKIGDVIKFINEHIEEIYKETDESEFVYCTIEFVSEYCTGISNSVYEYLADKQGYLLLNNYDRFESDFEQNPSLLEKVFKTGSISEVESYRFETVLNVWGHIANKPKSNLKSIVERLYRVLYSDVIKLAETANTENVTMIERKTTRFYSFLKKIKSPLANDFAITDRKIHNLINESLMKNGQVFSYEIPVKDIVEKWKTTKLWQLRLMSITHESKRENGTIEMVSRLSSVHAAEPSLIDLVSTNIPTDKYFTISRQQNLSFLSDLLSSTIIGILSNPDTLMDYLNQITSAMHFISENIDGQETNLDMDTHYLVNMIKCVADNIRNDDFVSIICYGISMYALSLSEKLLRMTYTSLVKDEIYVPISKATLGDLLNESNKTIAEIFGRDHLKCLSFLLVHTSDSRIGHSIRNSLAHWYEVSSNQMDIHYIAQCLWLFTDIMNTIFWFYLKPVINETL